MGYQPIPERLLHFTEMKDVREEKEQYRFHFLSLYVIILTTDCSAAGCTHCDLQYAQLIN